MEDFYHMSDFEVKDISNCKKEINVTVPVETIDTLREKETKKMQKKAQLPGFRKGKVPLNMVVKTYAATIEQNTADEAINQVYKDILNEKKFTPIDVPVLKDIKYDDNKNLVVKLEVETFPQIELKNYKNIKLTKTIYKIKDKDVDLMLENMRKDKATIAPVEDGAKDGHYVKMDMQELDELGVPLIGKKYEGFRVQLCSGKFDVEMEKQLLGVKTGEERTIEKFYSKKEKDKSLVGKVEKFLTKVESVEEEILPELNDQFVKDLNYEVKTVDELREKVKHNLEHTYADQAEQVFYNQLAHELLQENQFDVPEKMVEDYLDKIVEDIKNRDKTIDEATVRKNYKADATFNMKWFYFKSKIAEVEDIKVEDSDIDKYLEEIQDEKVRSTFAKNPEWRKRISNDLIEKKVVDYLVSNQKVKEVVEDANLERKVK
jgi:trigger factor